jgi:hypothetical protein
MHDAYRLGFEMLPGNGTIDVLFRFSNQKMIGPPFCYDVSGQAYDLISVLSLPSGGNVNLLIFDVEVVRTSCVRRTKYRIFHLLCMYTCIPVLLFSRRKCHRLTVRSCSDPLCTSYSRCSIYNTYYVVQAYYFGSCFCLLGFPP